MLSRQADDLTHGAPADDAGRPRPGHRPRDPRRTPLTDQYGGEPPAGDRFVDPAFDAWDDDLGLLLGHPTGKFTPEAWDDQAPED